MSGPEKKILTYPGGRGMTEQRREINLVINIEDFKGTPGFALLVIAANQRHSVADIDRALRALWGVERGITWITKRRWLFRQPEATSVPGAKPNADGLDPMALGIMRKNRSMSLSQLVRMLARNGINRGREWVRQHRLD